MALAVPATALQEALDIYSYGMWYVATTDTPQGMIRAFTSTGKACDYVGWLAEFDIESDTTYLIQLKFWTPLYNAWNYPEISKLAIYDSDLSVNYITDNQFNKTNSENIPYKQLASSTTTRNDTYFTITFMFSTTSGNIDNLIPDRYKLLCFYNANGQNGGATVQDLEIYAIKNGVNPEHEELINNLQTLITNQNTIINQNTDIYNQNNEQYQQNSTAISEIVSTLKDTYDTLNSIETFNKNALTNIIYYGSTYNKIDSNLIYNLGSAEDQLSSAEDALENKSSSLKNSVSSQWQQSTQTARSFVNTITPATAAITNIVTSVVTAMPAEVQTLLTVLPLLLFIGWLIGRVGGG